MARTNLPGNILKSLNTRLLGNLKSGVDTNIDLMQGQANLAEQGVQRYADISAQDFLSDIEAVNTGDPTQDLLARNQLVQQMKADPGLIFGKK